jgi:hypothetical protein
MKKRAISLVIFALVLTALTFAASGSTKKDAPCGTVTYMIGKATVTHNGKVVKLDIDSTVFNNDMIKTEDKAKVEISVDKSTGFSGKVVVGPKTSFYFKTSEIQGEASTTLDLMAGQVGMKVSKLVGSPSAQVRTESAACGVRGTEFGVVAAPSGDMLVTCDEGLVGLVGADGDEAEAGPGKALQRKLGERFEEMPVKVSSLEEFRDKWYADQIQALRASPMKALKQFADYYQKKKKDFLDSSASLIESAAFRRWAKEDENPDFNVDQKAPQTLKDLKELNRPILAMRKDLFLLERFYYRLEEIREILRDGPYWNAELAKDAKGNVITVKAFYKVFDSERDTLARRVALFRYAELLHLKRNPAASTGGISGSMGDDEFFEEEETEDDFFGK